MERYSYEVTKKNKMQQETFSTNGAEHMMGFKLTVHKRAVQIPIQIRSQCSRQRVSLQITSCYNMPVESV